MKKLAILLILALLCTPFSALAERDARFDKIRDRMNQPLEDKQPEAAEPEIPVYDDPMMNIATELIFNVHAVAGDENYLALNIATLELEYCPALAATDPYDLRSIHRIVIPEAALKLLLGVGANLSPAAMKRMNGTIATVVPSLWNTTMSSQALTECVLLQWSKPYPMPEGFSPCCWLVDCGGALYWIGFVQSNDDIITAHILPIWLNEGETVEDKLAYFDMLGGLIPVQQIWPAAQ